MLKTLKTLFKQDKEKFVIPKSVQAIIPIKTIWEDGIFLVGNNKYAKTFKFEDINYSVASREDKEAMFLEYSELLNALDSGATTKITVNNRRLNKTDFEQTILIPMAEDGLDNYRKEYNKMLLDKVTGANSIVQDKYVTVSVCKKNIEEARNYFARVGADLISHFARLGSKCVELEAEEKLRIFHDFYRTGEETAFHFDLKQTMRKGHDFKDFICPDTFEFEKDYFRIGDRYGRVIFLREYAAYIKDSMVAELCELNRNMMMSVDIIPVPTDEAVREVENRLLGVETNITNWQRKQNQNNNFSAVIPYDLEQQRKESKGNVRQKGHRMLQISMFIDISTHPLNQRQKTESRQHMNKVSFQPQPECCFCRCADAECITVRLAVHPGKEKQLQQHKRSQLCSFSQGKILTARHQENPCCRARNPPGKIIYCTGPAVCDAGKQQAQYYYPP